MWGITEERGEKARREFTDYKPAASPHFCSSSTSRHCPSLQTRTMNVHESQLRSPWLLWSLPCDSAVLPTHTHLPDHWNVLLLELHYTKKKEKKLYYSAILLWYCTNRVTELCSIKRKNCKNKENNMEK